MNRVTTAIERMKDQIQDRISQGLTTKEEVAQSRTALDMELSEFAKFQETKSIAMMEGKLNQQEAQTIYGLLGETVEHFNAQTVEVKYVLTKIFQELLEKKIRG